MTDFSVNRGSQFRNRKFLLPLIRHRMVGSMGRVSSIADNTTSESFFTLLQENALEPRSWAAREQ